MSETHGSNEDHDEPARYEIRIKGHLDARWADRFESMRFAHESDGTTILSGPVVDQAALHGLLRRVRDLGMPLLSVIRLAPGDAEHRLSNSKRRGS
jgi:hypothetical protein